MITLPSDVLLLGYLCWGVGSLSFCETNWQI